MKIGFILLSNEHQPQPSTRIAALNMFPHLRAHGWQPHIVYQPAQGCETPDLDGIDPASLADFDVVVFQKVHGESVLRLARALASLGVRTVYSVCDLVRSEMAQACDITLVISAYLKSLYPAALQSRIFVVHDGIEDSSICKRSWSEHRGSRAHPLQALLVTSAELTELPQLGLPPAWLLVKVVGRYGAPHGLLGRLRADLRQLRLLPSWRRRWQALRFMLHPRIRRLAWSPATVATALQEADMAILPIDTVAPAPGAPPPAWMLKSANRLTLMMGAGLPVVSNVIPAYEEVLQHGVNGLFAAGRQQWLACLERLRDPALRRSMGERARAAVLHDYSDQAQAASLLAALAHLQGDGGVAERACHSLPAG